MNYIVIRLVAIAGIVQIVTAIGRREVYQRPRLTASLDLSRTLPTILMLHFTGPRLSCGMLAVLAFVSPLSARGGTGKLAPVVDLNPRHKEAAPRLLDEPRSLIVAAEAMPLPTVADRPTARATKPLSNSSAGRDQPRPAVLFAAPFDPTSGVDAQERIAPTHASSKGVPLAPVIRVHGPIFPAQNSRTSRSKLAAEGAIQPNEPAAILNPVRERVNRSAFVATHDGRLVRTNATRTQSLEGHDTHSSSTIAAFEPSPPSNRVPSAADAIAPRTTAADRVSVVNPPPRLRVVQLATQDPIFANSELAKPRASAPGKLATEVPRSRKPLVTRAKRSPIESRRTEIEVASNPMADPIRAAASASPVEPQNLQDEPLKVAAASRKRASPVVELAVNSITPQSRTAPLPLSPTLWSKREPVLKLVDQTLSEQLAPTESVFRDPGPAATRRPPIRLADAEPLLAMQQPSPSASDLPSPVDEAIEEQLARELEAFELDVKPIHELSTRIAPEQGDLPKDYAAARFFREGEIAHRMGYSRTKVETSMSWEAPKLCYRPLYFQDINLERHGYKVPLVQPALSAAHFFGRVPLMPYMMVNEGHFNCQYTLGHYRPGDYAPYSLYIPRLRLDASAAELAVAAGLILAFP